MKRFAIPLLLIPLFLSCNGTTQNKPDVQEEIKKDYTANQQRLGEIQSQLLNDSLDIYSFKYIELIHEQESLQTALYYKYDYNDLFTFFETNIKGTINEYQYNKLIEELNEYKDCKPIEEPKEEIFVFEENPKAQAEKAQREINNAVENIKSLVNQ